MVPEEEKRLSVRVALRIPTLTSPCFQHRRVIKRRSVLLSSTHLVLYGSLCLTLCVSRLRKKKSRLERAQDPQRKTSIPPSSQRVTRSGRSDRIFVLFPTSIPFRGHNSRASVLAFPAFHASSHSLRPTSSSSFCSVASMSHRSTSSPERITKSR